MRTEHVSDEELDLLLLGEEGAAGAAEHARLCPLCRRRVVELRWAIGQLVGEDPPRETCRRVRDGALAAWQRAQARPRPVWKWAAAALVLLTLSLPLLRWSGEQEGEVDSAAVLAQVEELLAADPVGAAFPPDLVTALAEELEGNSERNRS